MRRLPRSRLGPDFSEGARLLWLAVEGRELDQKTLDAALGVSSGLSNRLLYGDRKPGRVLGERLRVDFGIPVAAWDQAPTVDFVPPGARDIASTGTEG